MSLHPALAAVRSGVRAVLQARAAAGPQHDSQQVGQQVGLQDGLQDGLQSTVLVACSGGADSLALLSATVFEGHKRGWRVVGVTVDHGLQAESGERAAAVVQQMAALGADETASIRVDVDPTGIGIEAAARQARYGVLRQLAEHFGSALVLLGHTRDDQAETVLLGLTRGSGARSLRGMRPAFEVFARPLLGVTRADTETACLVQGIEVWSDPHNSDAAYTRARIRHVVLPMLERELGPGVRDALARTADGLREDTLALDALAEREVATLLQPNTENQGTKDQATGIGATQIEVARLAGLPAAVRHRVIRLLALRAGALDAELFREHVVAVAELVTDWRGQRWIELPGHVRVHRVKGAADVITFVRQR